MMIAALNICNNAVLEQHFDEVILTLVGCWEGGSDVGGSDSDSEEEGEGDGEAYGNNPDARGLNRVVDILLSNGANPKATNSEMKTALDLAKAKGLRRPYRTMKRHLKSTKRKK
eukprot:jgi/Bigna1/144590/aug1.89_g19298